MLEKSLSLTVYGTRRPSPGSSFPFQDFFPMALMKSLPPPPPYLHTVLGIRRPQSRKVGGENVALTKPGQLFGGRHEAGVRKEGNMLEEEAKRGMSRWCPQHLPTVCTGITVSLGLSTCTV